jgi:hypothetical protein
LLDLKILFCFGFLAFLVLVLVIVNQESYATHTDCTNWAGLPDKDCDQLADKWEINKRYDKVVGGTTISVNLPAGVKWDHRDTLVEIDYMSHHKPPAAAIDPVVSKFNLFELLNADGTNGVTLHYIINDDVPHKTCINIWNDTDGDQTNDFDSIKKHFMGTSSERNSNPNFYQAKRDVFHYMLFIHTRCGTISQQQSSGGAEGPGNDAYVSLGYPGWGNVINGHDTGSTDYKAATFMHEYGHNLNLKHGGSADTPTCKPNYISVMNYLFQFPTYVPGRVIDYSHNVIPSLDENSLVEANGIGPSSPVGLATAIGHSTFNHPVPPTHKKDAIADNTRVNYNWYTGDSDTNDIVSSSITNFHFTPCNDDIKETLFGFDDVHYNSLRFWSTSGNFQNGTIAPIPANNVSAVPSIEPVPKLTTNSNQPKVIKVTMQNNQSASDILENATLPPCDVTVPGCADSPCDPKDPSCTLDVGHNFTDLSLLTKDFGNRTDQQEVTASDVLQVINSKVLDINSYIQSLNPNNFTSGTNVSKLKQDLQHSLVNATDSVYNLINSSKSDEALVKISKLRSLVDGVHPSNQILEHPNNELLKLVDELRIALEKRL